MDTTLQEDVPYEDNSEYEDEEGEEYVDEEDLEDGELEGEIEEEDEDDEVAELPTTNAPYIRGLEPQQASAGRASSAARQAPPQEWTGLGSMPGPTQKAYKELLDKLRADNKSQVTVLLLGKDQVGKTTLANALFNENAAPAANYAQQGRGQSRPQIISRTAAGFTLTVIDAPGLPEDGSNCDLALKALGNGLRKQPVDVVLYVDRLDTYRIDSADRQIMEAVSNEFSEALWKQTIIVFTHGRITALPQGTSYEDFLHQRSLLVRSAIRKASGNRGLALPAVAVENGWKCDTDDDKVRVLPDGTRWLSALMTEVVQTASSGQWQYDASKRINPDRKHRKWIPLILAAQLAFKFLVIDRIIDEDAVTGDQWGPYDEKVVRLERRRRKQAKEAQRAAKDSARSGSSGRRRQQLADDDDFDFEDY